LDFFRREWNFNFQKIRTTREPFQMLRETERLAVRDAHGFKQAVTKQKPAVSQWHKGFRFGQNFSVQKNEHAYF